MKTTKVEPEVFLTADDFVDSDYIMVRPALVRKIGDLPGVLLIARIQFRANISTPDAAGLKWWRASYDELANETGLSADTTRRTVERLVKKGLVLTKIENENAWDRTKSYRVPVRQMHVALVPDGAGASARSNQADLPDPLSTKEVKEEELKNTSRAPRSAPASGADDARPDVRMICEHFNASLIARDCKPKTITKEWRSSARLMIDADGHTLEQVLKCIDWVTAHSFWRRNVLSVPKLREKYERLRLEADEERKGKKISNRFHNQDATGARVDDNPFRKSA